MYVDEIVFVWGITLLIDSHLRRSVEKNKWVESVEKQMLEGNIVDKKSEDFNIYKWENQHTCLKVSSEYVVYLSLGVLLINKNSNIKMFPHVDSIKKFLHSRYILIKFNKK